jgi:hypothetical protein
VIILNPAVNAETAGRIEKTASDQSSAKIRPAVVVSPDYPSDDLLVCRFADSFHLLPLVFGNISTEATARTR